MNILKVFEYEKQMKLWRASHDFEFKAKKELEERFIKKCETIKILHEENRELKKQIKELEKKVGDPAEVVKKLLGRPIKFFDTYKMSEERYNAYYKEAQQVINNEAFQNELNCLVVDLVNSSARDTEDFRQVLNRRFTLCGIELLKQRIENMPKVTEEELPEDEELLESL